MKTPVVCLLAVLVGSFHGVGVFCQEPTEAPAPADEEAFGLESELPAEDVPGDEAAPDEDDPEEFSPADEDVASESSEPFVVPSAVGDETLDAGDNEASAADGSSGKKGLVGRLRGLMGILGPSDEDAESADDPSETHDEQDRRINELRRKATTSIQKKRTDVAISALNELISLKPYDPDYHLALGFCYRAKGSFREALRKYDDVLDLGGDKAFVALMRAEAFAVQGSRAKVFDTLKEAAVAGRNIINDMRLLKPLNKYQTDTDFIKLALSLERVQVDVSKIRDPFTNPFPTKGADPGPGNADVPVILEPEQQEELLESAKKLFERVKFYIKLEDDTKAMESYIQLKETLEREHLLTIPKIVSEFKVIRGKIPSVEIEIEGIRLKYYYRQAKEKLDQMKEVFEDGGYDRVARIHGEVLRLTEEMTATNENYQPVAQRILDASKGWFTRANIRKEFETVRPKIEGIIMSDDGRMAVLNGTVVAQGEFLDDLRVEMIESNKVTFHYKGEQIPVVFRRY